FHHPFADLCQFDAAVLHAAVGRIDAILQFQLEVLWLPAAPDQKGVEFDRLFRRALADDGFVLDPPELRIAVPAFERLSIEDGFNPRVIVRRQRLDARAATTTLTTRRAALPLRRACRRALLSDYRKGKKRRRDQSGSQRNELFHSVLHHFETASH